MNFKQVVEEEINKLIDPDTEYSNDRVSRTEINQAMTKAAMAVVEEMQDKVTTYQYVSSKCDCDEYSRTGCSHIGKETAFELITNELSNLKQQLSEQEALSALKE